jgi:cell division septum initiation protein DivIVA
MSSAKSELKTFEKKIGKTINLEETLMKMGATMMEKDKEIKKVSDHRDRLLRKTKKQAKEIEELKQEAEVLRDLLQNRMPTGCIAETTYQPILDENEKLKEEIEELRKS